MTTTDSVNYIIHAPNIHTGGGIILLQKLLNECGNQTSIIAILDERAKKQVHIHMGIKVYWCPPSLASRLAAEWYLSRWAQKTSRVLCFHGLPPLMRCKASVTVFVQNRLLITHQPLNGFKWKTRVRIAIERWLSKGFSNRVTRYVVQTTSMERDLIDWLGKPMAHSRVSVIPFFGDMPISSVANQLNKCFDFLYVADGEAHKNHLNLVTAWQLLAQESIYPSLCLTLGARDVALAKIIDETAEHSKLRISNAGHLTHQQVADLYGKSQALIFPSLTESFGLPLIEATHLGLPILAPELDYVRDVCEPAQTFDPTSPVSIARAVKRHLCVPNEKLRIRSPVEFLSEVLFELDKTS